MHGGDRYIVFREWLERQKAPFSRFPLTALQVGNRPSAPIPHKLDTVGSVGCDGHHLATTWWPV